MPTDHDQISDSTGELTESEKRIARERAALRAAVIHEAIRTEVRLSCCGAFVLLEGRPGISAAAS
jgi:hypothetical protein